MTYLLGLTGGIASGKSTISKYFKEKSIPVVDADIIARQVVEPNTEGLKKIVETFGEGILLPSGELDRKQLGQIIFNDESKRITLNSLLAKFIRQSILNQVKTHQKNGEKLVVLDIPLLFEGGYDSIVDEVMVSYIPKELQINRLVSRDNLSCEDALKRIDSQMDLEEKKQRADIVIDNSKSIEETYEQVDTWLTKKSLT